MDAANLLELLRQLFVLCFKLILPLLVPPLLAGLAASLLQSWLQLQDGALAVATKIVVGLLCFIYLMPQLASSLSEFAQQAWSGDFWQHLCLMDEEGGS
jgi:flagellar biosynthesis protein FliQ